MRTFNNSSTYKFEDFSKLQLIDLCYGIGLQYHHNLKKLITMCKKDLVKLTLEHENDIRKLIFDHIVYVSSNGHLRFDKIHVDFINK